MNFNTRRLEMVRRYLRGRDIRDERVLAAFEEVPRHVFVEEALWAEAYGDHPLPIGFQQTISQPYIVARMVEMLRLSPSSRVLEIGTGSGYQTAILSRVAAQVFSIERIPELARKAQDIIDQLSIRNVVIKVFDGTYGWAEMAPFDGIIVSAAAPRLPEPLKAQLAPGGRMIVPVGGEFSQVLQVVTRTPHGKFKTEDGDACVFVKLVGRYGW